jgi:hypothetical protein
MSRNKLIDDVDFDESDDVVDFDETYLPDLLTDTFSSDEDRVSDTPEFLTVDHLERDLDDRINALSEDDIHSLDVHYDDEDI